MAAATLNKLHDAIQPWSFTFFHRSYISQGRLWMTAINASCGQGHRSLPVNGDPNSIPITNACEHSSGEFCGHLNLENAQRFRAHIRILKAPRTPTVDKPTWLPLLLPPQFIRFTGALLSVVPSLSDFLYILLVYPSNNPPFADGEIGFRKVK